MPRGRSEEHTSELQSRRDLVCRLLLEKKKKKIRPSYLFHTAITTVHRANEDRTRLERLRICERTERAGKGALSGLIAFFFFNDTATTEIYTLSLHDALPI